MTKEVVLSFSLSDPRGFLHLEPSQLTWQVFAGNI